MNRVLVLLLLPVSIVLFCKPGKPPVRPELTSFARPVKGTLPWFIGKDMNPVFQKPAEKSKLRGLRNLSLVNQHGQRVTQEDLAGRLVAMSFFFTSCRGICPMVTENMKIVSRAFQNDSEVVMLSISVDPLRDNPERMKEYCAEHKIDKANWHLLSGPEEKVYQIAREQFDADVELLKGGGQAKPSDDFLHSELVYLLDREGLLRGMYRARGTAGMHKLVKDIEQLKQ